MSKEIMFSKFFSSLFLVFALFQLQLNTFAQDEQTRLNAENLYLEGAKLFSKNTPEAREEAFPKLTESLKLWKQIGDDLGQIKTLSVLNQIAFYRSDFKQCIEYSLQLLNLARKTQNKNLEGGVLGNLGYYHSNLGDSLKGLEYLKKSAKILNQIGQKQREAIALSNLASTYYSLGEIKKSVETFKRSLALKRETNDRAGETVDLINFGFIYDKAGDKQKALDYYRQALEITDETKNQISKGTVLNNMASVYQDLSEFQKALDHYNQSLEIRRQIKNQYGIAVSLQNIASIYRTLGEYEKALDYIQKALQIYQDKGFKQEEVRALTAVGAIYLAYGDKKNALSFYQKSLEAQNKLDSKSGYSNVLSKIGEIYLKDKEYQKAFEHFDKALEFARASQNTKDIADTLVFLARADWKLGKKQSAEANFNKALKMQTEIGLPFDKAETLYHYARFDESNGRRDSAIEKITEVIQIVENLRNSIVSENFRAKFLGEQQKYYDFYISTLVSQHKKSPDKGFDAKALQVSEKARGRSLLDTLGEISRNIRTQTPPELLEEEKLLRQTINIKDSKRIQAVKQKNKEKVAEYEKQLKEDLQKYEDLQTKIRQINPQFASLSNPEPLDLKQIQTQVLDEKSVLLEYFLGEEKSFLFFVSNKKLEIFELPKQAVLEKSVRQTIKNLKARTQIDASENFAQRTARINKADAEADKLLKQMSKVLISPIADKIKGKRLLVVSSGVLQYLPFSALKIQKSKSFLIETNEIVNLPTASVIPILREAKKNKKQTKHTISIIADPVFSPKDIRLKTALNRKKEEEKISGNAQLKLPKLRSDFSRLRFSRREAEAISKLVPNNQRFVALDFSANLNTANSEVFQNSKIVHLATHGIFNSQFPELSSIVFSLVNEQGESQEGFLRLYDIYNLELNSDLVVLSACDSALGEEIKGEGLIGLTRGFMYAGSPSVLASLWQVEDRATAELMKKFYVKMLKDGLKPVAALRKAQIETIKGKRWKNPFYWSAFNLQGEWQ